MNGHTSVGPQDHDSRHVRTFGGMVNGWLRPQPTPCRTASRPGGADAGPGGGVGGVRFAVPGRSAPHAPHTRRPLPMTRFFFPQDAQPTIVGAEPGAEVDRGGGGGGGGGGELEAFDPVPLCAAGVQCSRHNGPPSVDLSARHGRPRCVTAAQRPGSARRTASSRCASVAWSQQTSAPMRQFRWHMFQRPWLFPWQAQPCVGTSCRPSRGPPP